MVHLIDRRKYSLLFLFVILGFGTIQAQWRLVKCPTKNNLNSISFIDGNSGWIVGDRGTVLFSSEGEWKEWKQLTTQNLNSVFMINKNEGWIVGDKGTIMHFNGRNWELYDSPTSNNLLSVSFKDAGNGIATGDFGTVLVFKNDSWNILENETRGSLYSVFYDKDVAWIGGGLECVNVPIFKIGTGNGEKKVIDPYDTNVSVKSIMFLNPYNGWAVGSPGTILHFDGQEWGKDISAEDYSSLNSVFFSDENNGISVGFGGTVLIYSENLWLKENRITDNNLNGSAIINNKCYAVGDNGTIIQRNLNLQSAETYINFNNSVELQVFPNPCDEYMNVVIPCENDDITVTLTVNNIYGNIIIQKVLKFGKRGLTYRIFTGDLENGLYIIRADIKNKIISNKFIIRH